MKKTNTSWAFSSHYMLSSCLQGKGRVMANEYCTHDLGDSEIWWQEEVSPTLNRSQTIINKQQWHFSLWPFLMFSNSFEIFKKWSVLTKSSNDTNLWTQADMFSCMKCTVTIFSVHLWRSFLPFAYFLSTHCSRCLSSIKTTWKNTILTKIFQSNST